MSFVTRRFAPAVAAVVVLSTAAIAAGEPDCLSRTATHDDVNPPAVAAGYGFGVPLSGVDTSRPRAVAFDPLGKLLVADSGNDRVLRIDVATGSVIAAWGTTGSALGQLRAPGGIVADEIGRVFVADTGNDRVQVFSLDGVSLGAFGGPGSEPGRFRAPSALSRLGDGNLVVADTGNDRVQIVSPAGVPVRSLAGGLQAPTGVSAYRSSIYVADTRNHRIVRFGLDGSITGSWGGPGSAPGCLNAPEGIVAGRFGVFVADTASDHIVHFSRSGVPIERWGGRGSNGGQMMSPVSIAEDSGTLWVAEFAGNRLQRFRPRARVVSPVNG